MSINFQEGLSIITGETGAGKSIMLGALSLVLGKRADIGNLKKGTKKCIIEATYLISNYGLNEFFESNELDFEEQTIIRREILASGKSRGFINDTPVTLDVMQQLGSRLLDIHSQHQTLKLMEEDFQFKLIDALANTEDLLELYTSELRAYKEIKQQHADYLSKRSDLLKELDYNKFLLNELNEANLDMVDIAELEEEVNTLSNIEKIQENLGSASNMISEENIGVITQIDEILAMLSKIGSYNKSYQELYERFKSVSIELLDLQAELESKFQELESDPNRLDVVNNILLTIDNLLRKHHVDDLGQLKEIKDTLANKVEDTEEIDVKIERLQKEIDAHVSRLANQTRLIFDKRIAIIQDLEHKLQDILGKLGIPNARFKFELDHTDSFFKNGGDLLSVLFSANKGMDFKEIKKSASGGELSRIMLAIKYIISGYVNLPTIIFDEIDTGVSGEISNKMGAIMKEMSKSLQVISITHLPQIAAKGDYHYKVYKKEVEEKTTTKIMELDDEARIMEIAEMLGGSEMSNSAIAHAKQLLN